MSIPDALEDTAIINNYSITYYSPSLLWKFVISIFIKKAFSCFLWRYKTQYSQNHFSLSHHLIMALVISDLIYISSLELGSLTRAWRFREVLVFTPQATEPSSAASQ